MMRAPATPVKKKARYHKKEKKRRSLGHLLRRMLRRWRSAYRKRVIAHAANAPVPCPAQGEQPSSQEEGTEYSDSRKFAWPKSDDSGTPTPTLYENRYARYGQQTVRGSARKQAQSALHAKALCSREMPPAQVTPAPVARQRSSLWHYTDPGIISIPYRCWIPVVTLPRLVFPIMHPQSADRPLLNSSQPKWVDLVERKAEPLFSQSRALQAPDAWRFKPLAISPPSARLSEPARTQQSPQPGSNGDYKCPSVKNLQITRRQGQDDCCQGDLVVEQPTTNSGCMRSNSKKRHYPGDQSEQPASKRLRSTPSTYSNPWPLEAPETSPLSASAILPGKHSAVCALTQLLQSEQRKRRRTGAPLVEEPKIKIQRLIAGVGAFPGAPGLQNMQAAQPVQDILQQPIPRQQ